MCEAPATALPKPGSHCGWVCDHSRSPRAIQVSCLTSHFGWNTKLPFTAETWRRLELWLFAVVLVIYNWPLARGVFSATLIFLPSAVAAGEWWRLFTHPFVHVSWYHLLLDGTAFLLLYDMLEERRGFVRALYVAASAAGSLLAAWAWEPLIGTNGLCGLSGIAHGLMAVTALEMMASGETQPIRIAGWVSWGLVVGKCAWEALTGQALIEFLHFGLLGTPVAVCHAGGVLGGIAVFALSLAGKSCRHWRAA